MPTLDERYDEAIRMKEAGDLEGAVAALQQLVAEEPQFALGHAALSVFYQALDRNDDAVEEGRKVCQLEPEDPFSFVAMSLICQKAGRIPDAEQALMEARRVQFAAMQREE